MRVTIGLPCFGRPVMLTEALTSLLSQTERDFVLLVHENPSESTKIRETVEPIAARDPRVRYHRHVQNIGINGNFMSVLRAADTEFFMWAADDDIRHPEALSDMLAMLDAAPNAGLAGFSVEVINLHGETIDHHTGFSRFGRQDDRLAALGAFLDEPEIYGKANLTYGLFRRAALNAAIEASGGTFPDCWGPDLVLLAALIARRPVVATDRVLIRKRTGKTHRVPLARRFAQDYGWSEDDFSGFRAAMLAAMPDEASRKLAGRVLDARHAQLGSMLSRTRRAMLRLLRAEAASPFLPSEKDRWQ